MRWLLDTYHLIVDFRKRSITRLLKEIFRKTTVVFAERRCLGHLLFFHITADKMMSEAHFALACRQIAFARDYTHSLLVDVHEGQWFEQPHGAPTHLAWQIGHLAMSQYMLTLFRVRGQQPEDDLLISKQFKRLFAKGTAAGPKQTYPVITEILDVFQRVHDQVMQELPKTNLASLQESVVMPYAVYNTRLGSLLFCSAHEMLHAGQIGLIRRLLGGHPIR